MLDTINRSPVLQTHLPEVDEDGSHHPNSNLPNLESEGFLGLQCYLRPKTTSRR